MARSITNSKYDALLDAFRQYPGNAYKAAKIAGTTVYLAKKAWETGWERIGGPIKVRVEEEHKLARGRLWERSHEESSFDKAEEASRDTLLTLMEKAKLDAAETIAAEAEISRHARNASLSIYKFGHYFLNDDTLKKMGEMVVAALLSGDLTPEQSISVIDSMSRFAKNANEIAKLTIQIERMRVGEPTEIIGVKTENAEVPLEETLKEIDEIKALADLVRERAGSENVSTDSGPEKPN